MLDKLISFCDRKIYFFIHDIALHLHFFCVKNHVKFKSISLLSAVVCCYNRNAYKKTNAITAKVTLSFVYPTLECMKTSFRVTAHCNCDCFFFFCFFYAVSKLNLQTLDSKMWCTLNRNILIIKLVVVNWPVEARPLYKPLSSYCECVVS